MPNAICHAGSNDWKNSSGWKNVRTTSALTRRNATRQKKMLVAGEDGCDATRRGEEEALEEVIEEADMGVADMSRRIATAVKPTANSHRYHWPELRSP